MFKNSHLLKKSIPFPSFDFYSIFVIIAILLVYLPNWPKLPYFMDCYYHLAVMKGFSAAGGWVGHAFWEYAPYGRPHLYPPFFHFLELVLFKCGVGPILIARLFDFLIFPIFLVVVWRVVRKLYTQELAFYSLFLICSSYTLYLALINNIPFTIAFILGFLSFYFFKEMKPWSSWICLTFAFYTHPWMPWLMMGALVFYAFGRRTQRKLLLWICFGAIFAASPFIIHQLRYSHFFVPVKALEFYMAEINPLIFILGLAGVWFSFKKQGDYLFFLGLAFTMSFLLLTNRDRFLQGHGVIPFSFLGAVALLELKTILSHKYRNKGNVLFFTICILFFYLATPLILISPFREKPDFAFKSWLIGQIDSGQFFGTPKEETIYFPKYINKAVRLLTDNSAPDDIFFSNFSYAAGMISVLSERATSTAMLSEVKPLVSFDQIGLSRLILWFKDPDAKNEKRLADIVHRYRLEKIGETDVVYLYLNKQSSSHRIILPAVVPSWVCLGLLFLCMAAITIENIPKCQRHHKKSITS